MIRILSAMGTLATLVTPTMVGAETARDRGIEAKGATPVITERILGPRPVDVARRSETTGSTRTTGSRGAETTGSNSFARAEPLVSSLQCREYDFALRQSESAMLRRKFYRCD